MQYQYSTLMTKNYNDKAIDKRWQNKGPKRETVDFILNYSKALKINTYQQLKFESVLN